MSVLQRYEIQHCCFIVGKMVGSSATLESIGGEHSNSFSLGQMLSAVREDPCSEWYLLY